MSKQIEELEKRVQTHLNNMSAAVEGHLQKFQEGMVMQEARTNLAWNALNAVLKSFLDKGLITQEDILEAGADLAKEAAANMRATKLAASVGQMPTMLTRTPLELIQGGLTEATKKAREEANNGEG